MQVTSKNNHFINNRMKTKISCKSHHWIAEMTTLMSEKTDSKVDSLCRDNEVGCILMQVLLLKYNNSKWICDLLVLQSEWNKDCQVHVEK